MSSTSKSGLVAIAHGKDLDIHVIMQLPLWSVAIGILSSMSISSLQWQHSERLTAVPSCVQRWQTSPSLYPSKNRDIRWIQRGIAAHNGLSDNERDAFSVRDMIELDESSSESDTDDLLPPTTRRPPGRPKKQRMRSGGEHVGARIQHCGRCGEEGHSKRTCTNPLI